MPEVISDSSATEAIAQPRTSELLAVPGRCFFKNAVIYQIPEDFSLSLAEFEEKLAGRVLRPCGPLEKENSGWVISSALGRLVHVQENQFLVALGNHKKLLPASAVKEELNKRLGELAEEQGFPATRKQKRELKERVKTELLAKAMVKTTVTRAWLDTVNRWLVIEASGAARAEKLVSELRETLGSFAATLLEAEPDPASTLGTWLKESAAPGNFTLDTDLELRSPDKATIRYTNHPLDGEDIAKHLSEGKSVTRLGLTWSDRVAFIVTGTLELKKIKFLELATDTEQAEGPEQKLSAEEQFDADFMLMTAELGTLLTELAEAFGIKGEQ